MFLKKSQFTRNGKPYTYYKIVSTYKDESGRNRHKLVKHLGKLSDEEAEKVRRVLKEQGKLLIDKSGVLESEAVKLASVQQEIPLVVMLDAQL